ncbi:hypothetical protein [Rheinheimera salexigens]|uniref:Uncharacterized protein n=1 Tax=Rheinheimera salexigens TaxID=1628148 RepID=A0A1E7Q9V1_9GAMM|nr:hypothetical protein [Rheinheimera salexigens]OEY70833.1 hypothetical protein BI198_15665 [Rheinheimera salexigens]
MRWLSRFALVFYLSILCTPQAFAVQDLRLSPLAETQLQGLVPNVSSYTLDHLLQQDDQPPTGLITANLPVATPLKYHASTVLAQMIKATLYQQHQARAPPLTSSLI